MKPLLIILGVLLVLCLGYFLMHPDRPNAASPDSSALVTAAWQGYKHHFIDAWGRVMRPENDNDTVSEGQAYAMLRSVWLDDQSTFDACYRWTQEHLAGRASVGTHLPAWHWHNGTVMDPTPASDADLDYALSLLFAHARWSATGPSDLPPYRSQALAVLDEILQFETYTLGDGRLYLSPWPLSDAPHASYPVNPSYYSPAHFRIFHRVSGDPRWLALLETTYTLLESLQKEFDGQQGIGLVPDWCAVDIDGRYHPLDGKSSDFGYEALRVPFRLGLDALWFDSPAAARWLKRFDGFVETQWSQHRAVYAQYTYSGQVQQAYENPAFYACYAYAAPSSERMKFIQKTRAALVSTPHGLIYHRRSDYYTNSLAWLAEAQHAGFIENLCDPSP